MAQRKAGSPTDDILARLKSFYEFMTHHGLESLELDDKGFRLRLVRRRTAGEIAASATLPAVLPASVPSGTLPAGAVPAGTVPVGATAIKAGMMGIFYRAPSPSSPPFVKEGDSVKAGQVLCMIEAMKVFNEVKSEYPCTILKVLLENGKPVKSGQDILLVKRD